MIVQRRYKQATLLLSFADVIAHHLCVKFQCVSDSECCTGIKCHRYANRCQVQITEAELMAQREKILGRRGKDYK